MTALVIAEHDQSQLQPATLSAITAALQLTTDVTVVIASNDGQSVAEQVAKMSGVSQVLQLEADALQHPSAEQLAPLIVSVANDFQHIIAAATTFGKNLLPRIAALLDVGQVSDVIRIIDSQTFERPIYAGNAIATVKNAYPKNVFTIRTTAFDAVGESGTSAPISRQDVTVSSTGSRYLSRELSQSERPDLTQARVVVSGGRALASQDNFTLLEQVADLLGGAVGASRAAVDAGYVPNDYQVGQTGKVVAPELYIAVGISGAVQHIAGMKDSKVIVAINRDPDAPIFKVANYGVVGDLFEILPMLTSELEKIQ